MDMRVKSGVALLSGGLDSSVALFLAQRFDLNIELVITFDYGQRAAKNEISAAEKLCSFLNVPFRVIEVPFLKTLKHNGGLIDSSRSLPTPTLSQLEEANYSQSSARAVWVPNRNGLFIEIAAAIAEDIDAGALVVGFNKEEAETFPDNSVDYLAAITHALSYSTSNQVQVLSPTANLKKSEIVQRAKEEGFPFDHLWSCYEAGDKMCGRCESCMRLKRAFASNHIVMETRFADASI